MEQLKVRSMHGSMPLVLRGGGQNVIGHHEQCIEN